MPKSPRSFSDSLLVEGKNDCHVIHNLSRRHGLEGLFEIEASEDGEGIEALLASVPLRLRTRDRRTLGIVIDADQDVARRWQQLCDRLRDAGYQSPPGSPVEEGWISAESHLPRVGLWLLPDNRAPGMLEDFVTMLVPQDDVLLPVARRVIVEIEQSGSYRYQLAHHAKALIHTWLAWQETPGQPMGQAITARVLSHDSAVALKFVRWIKLLFSNESHRPRE